MSAVHPRRVQVTQLPRRVASGFVARVRATPAVLAVLLVVAAVHGTAWAVVTAPWNGPDEVAHFAYAEHLAQTGHAPQRNRGNGSQSAAENLALFKLNLFPIRLQPTGKPTYSAIERVKRELGRLPDSTYKDGSGPNPAANYPPLYYAYEAIAYRLTPSHSELTRLFVMRMATVLLLVATVALTWLIAAELLAATWARALATGLVALQPKLGFGGGIVNPDVMLAAVSTGALLAALRIVRRGPRPWSVVGLAACSCAGVLTHPRGYFLVPFAVIALAIAAWRFRPALRPAMAWAAGALGIMVLAVAAAMLWVHGHTQGPAGNGAGNPSLSGLNPRQFLSYLWQFYLPKLSFMDPKVGPSFYGYRQVYIESFFGNFASFSVNYRPIYYDALQLLAGLGIAALYTTAVVRWRTLVANWPIVVVSAVFFLGLMALLHIVSFSSLRASGDPVITGRYLLPAIALYGCAAAWVCSSLPRRLGLPLGAILLGFSVLLAMGGVGLSIGRFYE
jgi:4-amino-4-deoxy-L-arabinose transferase-like glycosyltransferase